MENKAFWGEGQDSLQGFELKLGVSFRGRPDEITYFFLFGESLPFNTFVLMPSSFCFSKGCPAIPHFAIIQTIMGFVFFDGFGFFFFKF